MEWVVEDEVRQKVAMDEVEENGGKKMKIAIPTMGKNGFKEEVCPHFGRAPLYAIIDSETNEIEFIENVSEHFGGTGKPPDVIGNAGANIVLCAGMGHRAMMMFEERGIEVYCGAEGPIDIALKSFKDGKLQKASESTACKDHRH
ncbi:MAG: NifB/NifX family molybdenum-iron cluster-binding protein [Candidatus Altiarchaeota archaeon]